MTPSTGSGEARGVLILTPYFHPIIGGVESNAERLARYLVSQRVTVRVLTKRIGRGLADDEDRDGIAIGRVGPSGERSSLGKWLMTPAVVWRLVRDASGYDVVCCVDYRATGIAALFARRITGRPVVFQAQTTGVLSGDNIDPLLRKAGIGPAGAIAGGVKGTIRALYRGADAFACISRDIERETLACGVPRERVWYLPNAIDMTHFRPAEPGERDRLRRERNLPLDRVVCLFVGRLSREKGVLELLEAWRRLQPSDARLVIAGPDMPGHPWDAGGPGRAFVEQHGLGASVRFVGPLADVAPMIKAADLVVQPSHFEALGLSAIEALACGVPLVASAVGGLLDFVVEGENGRLCPPRDPAALASCIGPLLTDSGARARLAARARVSVLHEYDELAVFGRMRALFDRLAAAR
ncbi:MAG TPA: glycosyltransferase family 4 protein [Vicinamibacterales bacterium]|nr:glycosyltransferase family 4 protein [Vicinamibacterales bacterium]